MKMFLEGMRERYRGNRLLAEGVNYLTWNSFNKADKLFFFLYGKKNRFLNERFFTFWPSGSFLEVLRSLSIFETFSVLVSVLWSANSELIVRLQVRIPLVVS